MRTAAIVVSALLLFVLVESALPASSAAFGTVDRGTGLSVSADETGVASLNTSTSVEAGAVNCLTKVTNKLGAGTATVEMHLINGSESKASLRDPDNPLSWASNVTFPLAQDASKEVRVDTEDLAAGDTLYFNATLTTGKTDFSVDRRTVPVVNNTGQPNLSCL